MKDAQYWKKQAHDNHVMQMIFSACGVAFIAVAILLFLLAQLPEKSFFIMLIIGGLHFIPAVMFYWVRVAALRLAKREEDNGV
ncbi:hypothetical protein SEA_BOOPY_34 [Gordonia phage Boopy]|nr:hypothetical protein SEA_BOOPY_34 [Gordonia phage Boopy]UXE04176.1 hypothetical protein SEA_BLUENGOLD_32 [Gordonia phage BlueNGold]WBF03815.1 hypothetical protein SEA_MAREELIH_32 [Gordonia phage Mareelih]